MITQIGNLGLDYHEFSSDSNECMMAEDDIWYICLISEIGRLILEGLAWLDLKSHCLENDIL